MGYEEFNKIDEEYFSTILDDDFNFEGTIKVEESIIVKGKVKGKIEVKGMIVVGPNSYIEADIQAKNFQCFGKIKGNLTILEESFFHSPSSLDGDLTTPLLAIENGCIINGKIKMNKKE